jgi:hypothetical protein
MRPRQLLAIAAILGFIAFLTWSTLSAQKVTCTVCVVYDGQHNCAAASQANDSAATRSAQTTACGPVTHGMNDAIACSRLEPVSVECRRK